MTTPNADTGDQAFYGDTNAGDAYKPTADDYARLSTTLAEQGVDGHTGDNGPAADGDDVDDAGDADQDDRPGKEAQRLRHRLRDTQGHLDTATARATTAQRGLIDYLVEASGIRPAAVYAAGFTVADMLDDQGDVDPGKVQQAADHASSTLGLRRLPRPDKSQASSANSTPSTASWSTLIQGKK